MSDDQLKAFMARLKEDSNLRSMLDAEKADPVEIAKSFGFVIRSASHYHFLLRALILQVSWTKSPSLSCLMTM